MEKNTAQVGQVSITFKNARRKTLGRSMGFILPAIIISVAAILWLRPEPAAAHVKWFVEFDLAETPRQLTEVLTGAFGLLLLATSITLLIAYRIDIEWSRARRFDWFGKPFSNRTAIADTLVRIGTNISFIMLSLIGGGVILTPDLPNDAAFLPYLHLSVALFVLFESTIILSALSILALYGYGIAEYGLYHMLDYTLFPGLAVYLALLSVGGARLKQHRLPLLTLSIVFCLLWSAIEKFAYPQRFDPFLDNNEFLTMGLPRDFFLTSTAFVEFTLAYVILTGRNMVVLAALALNLIMISGAFYFGIADTIGHLPIIVILTIIIIKGPSAYSVFSYRENRGILAQTGAMVMGYWSALILITAIYYGFHHLAYGGL